MSKGLIVGTLLKGLDRRERGVGLLAPPIGEQGGHQALFPIREAMRELR